MTFRPPIIITIYPRPKAVGEPVGTLASLLTPNPSRPFHQDDWPRPAPPGKVQASDAPANLYPWQHPNPPQPFFQDDWTQLANPGRPKAVGEAIGTLNVLLTPNPSHPFHQDDWSQLALPSRPKAKVDDFVNLSSQTFFIISQDLWDNPASRPKAKVDDFVNLLPVHTGVVVVTLPFNEYLWDSPALSRPKAGDSSAAPPSSLLTPNPSVAFSQSLWEGEPARPKAKVDDFVNLTPLQSAVVIPFPFELDDWPLATQPRPKITDTSVAASSALYTPNPAQPFSQTQWDLPIPGRQPLKSDIYVNLPTPAPFTQGNWPSAVLAKPKIPADSFGIDLPNLPLPFGENDWPAAAPGRQKIAADSYGVDLPLNFPFVQPPFVQGDWPSAVLGRQKVYAESLGLELVLNFPNPTRPFQQTMWDNATRGFPAAAGHFYPINPNLQPPPIIIPAKPDNLHFLADVGRMMSR